jgi:TonB family protein
VVIAFTIGADGQVRRAEPSQNTTGDEALARCLAGAVRQWRLPPPPGGEVELEMPFSR